MALKASHFTLVPIHLQARNRKEDFMTYTAEESRRHLENNKKRFCPLSFSSGTEMMYCQTLDCMLYDDEIHECALGRKTYLDEEEDDA